MRTILFLWAAPTGLFWGWYFLSLHNLNFGLVILSRKVHDFVFDFYGHILGVDPAAIPAFVARSCAFDATFLCLLYVFRRRRQIAAWWRKRGQSGGTAARNMIVPGK